MREHVILISCDLCKAYDGAREDAENGEHIRVFIDGKPKRLDVCVPKHENPTWREIVEYAWPDVAADDMPAPSSGKTLVCAVCGKRVAKNERGMSRHMLVMHGGETDEPRDVCPVCGTYKYGTPHGLVMHMARTHADVPKDERQAIYDRLVRVGG